MLNLKQFASMLDGRLYGSEITKEEEKLAKELGFVVVFGYSDDNAELRGAIDDEIGCFNGGELRHKDLPAPIYADWCPEDIDCSWAYGTSIPHEKFYIYEDGELYCVGIVCDISKKPQTNADHIRRMTDEELARFLQCFNERICEHCSYENHCTSKCIGGVRDWLQQPYKENEDG